MARYKNIYYDPVTEKHLEGRALLVRKIDEDETFQTWEVKFLDGGADPTEVFRRKILRRVGTRSKEFVTM